MPGIIRRKSEWSWMGSTPSASKAGNSELPLSDPRVFLHLFSVPPLETKWNGKQCPACHEWSNTCKEEVVNCTGANIYCFDISAHVHSEKIVDRTLKGCTSKSFCLSLKSGRTPMLGGSDELRKAECSPDVSRGAQGSDLLLPTFSGLLLLKILS
ncbi:protein RoBo-1-like [Podarcis muralis]